jgi:hypothetical protein
MAEGMREEPGEPNDIRHRPSLSATTVDARKLERRFPGARSPATPGSPRALLSRTSVLGTRMPHP